MACSLTLCFLAISESRATGLCNFFSSSWGSLLAAGAMVSIYKTVLDSWAGQIMQGLDEFEEGSRDMNARNIIVRIKYGVIFTPIGTDQIALHLRKNCENFLQCGPVQSAGLRKSDRRCKIWVKTICVNGKISG